MLMLINVLYHMLRPCCLLWQVGSKDYFVYFLQSPQYGLRIVEQEVVSGRFMYLASLHVLGVVFDLKLIFFLDVLVADTGKNSAPGKHPGNATAMGDEADQGHVHVVWL